MIDSSVYDDLSAAWLRVEAQFKQRRIFRTVSTPIIGGTNSDNKLCFGRINGSRQLYVWYNEKINKNGTMVEKEIPICESPLLDRIAASHRIIHLKLEAEKAVDELESEINNAIKRLNDFCNEKGVQS